MIGDGPEALPMSKCHVNQVTAVRALAEWPLWVRHSKMHMHRFTVFLVLQLSLCFFCSFPVRCSWILIVASRGTAWECDPGRVVVLPILKFFENGKFASAFACFFSAVFCLLWALTPGVEVLRMQSTLCLKVSTKVVCVTMFAEVIGREIISDRHDLGLWSTSIEFVGVFDTWARKNTFIHIPCSSFSDSESEGECAVCSFKRQPLWYVYLLYLVLVVLLLGLHFCIFLVPGPDLAMICCEQIKKPCASATLHVTTQILRKSFKFRHRNENKWNVVEIGWKYANLGVWEAVKHPLSRPGTLEDRWSFGVQLSYERFERCFNHLRCYFQRFVHQREPTGRFLRLESFSNMRNKIFPNGFWFSMVGALQCTKVYSTCSLNPIEDEAHDYNMTLRSFIVGSNMKITWNHRWRNTRWHCRNCWGWRNGRVCSRRSVAMFGFGQAVVAAALRRHGDSVALLGIKAVILRISTVLSPPPLFLWHTAATVQTSKESLQATCLHVSESKLWIPFQRFCSYDFLVLWMWWTPIQRYIGSVTAKHLQHRPFEVGATTGWNGQRGCRRRAGDLGAELGRSWLLEIFAIRRSWLSFTKFRLSFTELTKKHHHISFNLRWFQILTRTASSSRHISTGGFSRFHPQPIWVPNWRKDFESTPAEAKSGTTGMLAVLAFNGPNVWVVWVWHNLTGSGKTKLLSTMHWAQRKETTDAVIASFRSSFLLKVSSNWWFQRPVGGPLRVEKSCLRKDPKTPVCILIILDLAVSSCLVHFICALQCPGMLWSESNRTTCFTHQCLPTVLATRKLCEEIADECSRTLRQVYLWKRVWKFGPIWLFDSLESNLLMKTHKNIEWKTVFFSHAIPNSPGINFSHLPWQLGRACGRHLMDTGGFFVATFEKRADLASAAQMTGAKGTDKEIAFFNHCCFFVVIGCFYVLLPCAIFGTFSWSCW